MKHRVTTEMSSEVDDHLHPPGAAFGDEHHVTDVVRRRNDTRQAAHLLDYILQHTINRKAYFMSGLQIWFLAPIQLDLPNKQTEFEILPNQLKLTRYRAMLMTGSLLLYSSTALVSSDFSSVIWYTGR